MAWVTEIGDRSGFLAVTGVFGCGFWLFLAWVRCFWLWFLVVVVVFVLKGVVGRGWVRGLGLGWVVGGL